MKQRVNIQYSVDIDDLPSEVERLLSVALAELKTAQGVKINKGADVMSLATIEQIASVRGALGGIDHALSDIDNLVTSYLNYKTRPAESPPDHPEPEAPVEGYSRPMPPLPPGMPTDEQLDALQAKIGDFKKSLAMQEEPHEVAD